MGAVLAGGLSTRFGSDKAMALIDGQRLLDHAVAALRPSCDIVIVIGRIDPVHHGAPDWPRAGMGPLGGIAGALRAAAQSRHGFVLTCGVDSLGLPPDLPSLLAPAPACLISQPVIGLWPVATLEPLQDILAGPGKHAVHRFAEAIGARAVTLEREPINVNYPDDLLRVAGGEA